MERLAYSVEEVARMIGCSRRTVVREVQRGRLSVIRVGRLVRIPARSLCIYGEMKLQPDIDAGEPRQRSGLSNE